MFNGIAIQHSLASVAHGPFAASAPSDRDLGAFVQIGNFQLDLAASKVVFDDEALKLHGISGDQHEFGIGEWISFYHADDRLSVLKLIKQATTLMRGFRFQARPAADRDLAPTIECYVRCDSGEFSGVFLSSRLCYAFVE